MRIGFVGGGKMGSAMVAALVGSEGQCADDIVVTEPDESRRQWLQESYGVQVEEEAEAAIVGRDVVVLAVKPQILDEVVDGISRLVTDGQLIVSIAAGKLIETIQRRLPGAHVVRVMPNLGTTVGEGMSVFCTGTGVTDADRDIVLQLLRTSGKVLELPEAKFHAVTALSGSGPAFWASYLEGMIEAGVALGLPTDAAGMMALQTMKGTAAVLDAGDVTASELIKSVSSPGGTTMAGLAVLNASEMKEIAKSTLRAAATRSEELGR